MPALGSWWAALYAGAVGVLGLGAGLGIGWRTCVRWAANLDDWAAAGEPEPEPLAAVRICPPDLTLAASLPGPLTTYRPDPERAQWVPWACDPDTEYLQAYAPLWAERAARLAWVERQVGLIMQRIGGA